MKDVNDWSMEDQYSYYLEYYSKIYEKVTVFLQAGDFYEMYCRANDPDSLASKNFFHWKNTLYWNMSENKNGRLMIGFPMNSKSKWLEVILGMGYTVVQVDQLPKHLIPEGAKTTKSGEYRTVTIIHSPGTAITEVDTVDNRYLVCIYLEAFKDPAFDPVTVGISAIDVTTGQTVLYEVYNNREDQNYATDEITRFLQSFRPKEVLFYSKSSIEGYKNNIKFKKEFTDTNYQASFISKIYTGRTIYTFGIERFVTAMASLVALLQYCIDHNPQIVKNLSDIQLFSNSKYLQLTNNSVQQLDIINNKADNLFNLVNFTNTAMGHRMLQTRLLFPLKDPEEINQRLDMVEKFSDYKPYEPLLRKIGDVEKIVRKLYLFPGVLFNLLSSFRHIKELLIMSNMSKKSISGFLQYLETTVDENGLQEGVSDELDEVIHKIKKYKRVFDTALQQWECMVGKVEMVIDDESCRFKITHSKFAKLHADVTVLSKNKTYVYFTNDEIKNAFCKYQTLEESRVEIWNRVYKQYIDDLLDRFNPVIVKACNLVASIDVAVSSAKCAHKYRYTRPVLKGDESYIAATGLRHPIIERITSSIYVPHDISLGEQKGMLIYGFNAAGKSSLMKTVGCNLIMAQAGLFVAAGTFSFYPYDNILTRIIGNDDMSKGLSSFAVEMSELNGIFSRATSSSLILGDELSRGTESDSAVAIVASAIHELVKKGAQFLFATHLHQLVDLVEDVKIVHVAVEINGKEIIYRRDLKDGPGDALYGIEVARAMGLPDTFITRALEIRKRIVGENNRVSQYNKEMILSKCGVCGKSASEVHHINYQRDADKDGFIGHFHKNHISNLVGLCNRCHKQLHNGKLTIHRWIDTSNGRKLEWEN